MSEISPELYSVEAEQSLLGAMMLNPDCIVEVAAKLTGDEFFRHDHREIYRACIDLEAQKVRVDLLTVCNAIGKEKIVYLGELARNCVAMQNATSYADIIRERYDRRLLFAAGLSAQGMASSGLPMKDAIGKVRSQIDDIGPKSSMGNRTVEDYMSEWRDELQVRMERGDRLQGKNTGFSELNNRWFGLCEPDLIIIAGRPSMGKTTLGLNIAEGVTANGGSVLFFSLEMSAKQLTDKRVSAITGIPLDVIRRAAFSTDQWGLVTDAAHKIKQRKFVINETSGISIDAARMICMSHQSRHGLDAVFFDYLGLMTKPGAENRLQEVKAISAGLKGIAKDLKIPVVALAQLNRKCEDRANKRPLMADLRESGDIEQDADIVAFVHRQEKYEPDAPQWKGIAEIITDKHRNGECGTDFVASNLQCSRFYTPEYPIAIPGKPDQKQSGRESL
jgi:replicative DNA helicase